jgi:hypothetical protein
MTTPTAPRLNPSSNGELIAVIAQLLATYPQRIDRADDVLRTASDPIRSSQTDRTTGSREPALPMLSFDCREAIETRRRLTQAVRAIRDAERDIAAILHDWAPLPVKRGMGDSENAALWCPQCLKHGYREPRGANGTRHCSWCCDVHRNYGSYPNAALMAMHRVGRRISDTEYRRQLGKGKGAA